MKFRTEIEYRKLPFTIDHKAKFLSLGSCFANSIGRKLQDHKFDISINPFGIIYNPKSLFEVLEGIVSNSTNIEDSIVHTPHGYVSLLLHSDFNSSTPEELIKRYSSISDNIRLKIKSTDTLIISLGTAFIYHDINKDMDVANCHKIPSTEFEKRLLNAHDIMHAFDRLYKILHKLNPKIRIILTVSPIRHTREGLKNNQLSKSVLRVACSQIEDKYPNVIYFPSYEIMIDDLRDYRYYKEDLIHPSDMAINYIWEYFQNSFFSEKTLQIVKEWTGIIKNIEHRPFNPKDENHQKFLHRTLNKLDKFELYFDCSKEKEFIQSQIL